MNIFLIRLFTSATALWAVAQLGVGLSFENTGFFPVIISALVLGFVNATLRPILVVLTFPFTFVTFGFFLLVVNAITVSIVAALTPLNVANFGGALVGGVFLTVTNIIFQRLLGTGRESDSFAGTIAGNAPSSTRSRGFTVEFGNQTFSRGSSQPSRNEHVYQDEQNREITVERVEKVSRDKLN